jgi:hypothetical protein
MRMHLLAIVGVSIALTALGRAQEGSAEAKAILAKAIEAHGGAEKLEKHKAGRIQSKGKLELFGGAEFTQKIAIQHPNKFRDEMEMQIMGNKLEIVTIYDGKNAAVLVAGKKVPLNDAAMKAIQEGAESLRLMKLSGLKEKGVELAEIGEATVNDKPAIGLRVSRKGAKDVNLYFDKKTHLVSKLEHRVIDPMNEQELTEERIITEYQEIDGMKAAKKILILRDGKRFLEAEISNVQGLDSIDDGEFRIPD